MQAMLVTDPVRDRGTHSRAGAGFLRRRCGGRRGRASSSGAWRRRLRLAAPVAAAVSLGVAPAATAHAAARGHGEPEWLVFHPAQYPFDLALRSSGRDEAPAAGRMRAPASEDAARPPQGRAAPAAMLLPRAVAPGLTTAVMTETLPSPAAASGQPPRAWTWGLAGAVILLLRLVSVGGAVTVLGRCGVSSFVVAAAALAFDLTWQVQASIFAVAAVTLAVAAPVLRGGPAAPAVGGRGPSALVGRQFKLKSPITGGQGMLTADDGRRWRVTAARDCAAGKSVRVVAANGTLLTVDPVDERAELTGAT